jgi:hypothetical protein
MAITPACVTRVGRRSIVPSIRPTACAIVRFRYCALSARTLEAFAHVSYLLYSRQYVGPSILNRYLDLPLKTPPSQLRACAGRAPRFAHANLGT